MSEGALAFPELLSRAMSFFERGAPLKKSSSLKSATPLFLELAVCFGKSGGLAFSVPLIDHSELLWKFIANPFNFLVQSTQLIPRQGTVSAEFSSFVEYLSLKYPVLFQGLCFEARISSCIAHVSRLTLQTS